MAWTWSPAIPAAATALVRGGSERAHMVGVRLRGVVGVFPLAMQRIFLHRCAQPAAFAVHDGHPHAQGSEINSCNDGHGIFLI